MRFSIIIPAYNAGSTIRRAIDSALRQPEAEVIVVNDCSTDKTGDIAQSYHSVRYGWTDPVNLGPGIARNIGLEMAQGDWIIFLDADDELMPGALNRIWDFIQAQPIDIDLVGFNWIGDGHDDGQRRDGHWLNGSKEDLLNAYVSLRMDGAVTFTAIRRSSLGDLRFRAGYHEDVDYLFNAYAIARRTAYFDNICYIKHGSGITSTVTEKHIDGFIDAWDNVLAAYNESVNELTMHLSFEEKAGIIAVVATRVREIYRKGGDHRDHLLNYLRNNLPLLYWNTCQDTEMQTQYAKIAREFVNHGHVDQSLFSKRWSCKDLQNSAYLGPDQIRACCKRFFVDGERRGDVVLLQHENIKVPLKHGFGEELFAIESNISLSSIMQAKLDLLDAINAGEQTSCTGCPWLEFKEWGPVTEDIDYLSMEHHSVCNLRCNYCSDIYFGGQKPAYDVQKLVNQMATSVKTVVWGGGEPTLSPEFKTLALMFARLGAKQRILSNSVIYSDTVRNLLESSDTELTTSIDAGTPDLFKKIRGADKFYAVLSNLRKYSGHNPDRITIKYILTEENCSSFELNQFVKEIQAHHLLVCNFQISCDFRQEKATEDELRAVVELHALLIAAGAECVFIDDLCRIRIAPIQEQLKSDLRFATPVPKPAIAMYMDIPIASSANYGEVLIWGFGEQYQRIRNNSLFFSSSPGDHVMVKRSTDSHEYNHDIYPNAAIVIAASQSYPAIYRELKQRGIAHRVIKELVI